ncbi:MAG: peptidase S1, partial [Treponema sp.]|nr:peptidase S1 [Treponema sp.]
MKVYSRRQLVFFSVLSALIVLALAFGLGLIRLPGVPSGGEGAVETAVTTAVITGAEAGETTGNSLDTLSLRQSPQSLRPINALNTTDLAPYNEEERENISIYEQYNAAVVNITTEVVAINWFLEPVP